MREMAVPRSIMSANFSQSLLVLANSMKKGGRCVAGIEISASSGGVQFGEWMRPVDPEQAEGTIPSHRVNIGGRILRPLECVKIRFTAPAGDRFHPEDFLIDTTSKWEREGEMSREILKSLPDESEDLWGAETAESRRVMPFDGIKTLRIIKPSGACHVTAYRDETPWGTKHRRLLHIEHQGHTHHFSIDDPLFGDRHQLSPAAVGDRTIRIDLEPSKTIVVASLTKPYEGYQYKIAATIFEL